MIIVSVKSKVMENQCFIGIDISKRTLDICVYLKGKYQQYVIDNQADSIRDFLNQLPSVDQIIIGMENTGRYNFFLYEVLASSRYQVYVISALHLHKSLGLTRGKNDVIDSERITNYLRKHYLDIEQWEAPSEAIQKLKVLLTERSQRINIIRQLKATAREYGMIQQTVKEQKLDQLNQELIDKLNHQVIEIEKKIDKVLDTDQHLKKQAELIESIPGVGRVLCWILLAKTNNFKTITTPRKLACYAGVVPFQHQSGTSIRRKERVSRYADKNLKTCLHMGAMSAIRLENDLSTYYRRKVSEGKNKMSVLNAVRNKIIHRVFAVIKKQEPYLNFSPVA